MTTIEEIKRKGWGEVILRQTELSELRKKKPETDSEIAELLGRLKGMVYILNLIK